MVKQADPRRYRIAAVIPAFRVEREIQSVLRGLPSYLKHIIVVDDASPDRTSELVRVLARRDPRLVLIRHERNQGVGGAMVSGFRKAIELDAWVVVKIDGDGQMDNGPGNRAGRQQSGGDQTDPLGRPLRGREFGDDFTVKVPGEIDVERVRRILEELRRRLADPNRPQIELDYIERLLKDY